MIRAKVSGHITTAVADVGNPHGRFYAGPLLPGDVLRRLVLQLTGSNGVAVQGDTFRVRLKASANRPDDTTAGYDNVPDTLLDVTGFLRWEPTAVDFTEGVHFLDLSWPLLVVVDPAWKWITVELRADREMGGFCGIEVDRPAK